MSRQILQPEQKALEINLDEQIYGTFAEIGAGQEVARNFFQAGAAAGTICKTMSAYDKTYSDEIYGCEDNKRYVCESRLYNMLDHEYELMEQRLQDEKPNTNFFVFADTVAAINYQRTIEGNGWLGIRFQLKPNQKPNNLIIHVRMNDNDNRLQQEAIGLLGVNMIYACYFLHDNLEDFVQSLIDGIQGRVNIDLMTLNGPGFEEVDDRICCLYLVKYGLNDVAIFDENGKSIHASEHFYRKDMVIVRGHFRPPTLVTLDVFDKSFKEFAAQESISEDKIISVAEIPLDNLRTFNNIDNIDYIERADALNALGKKVIISNCENHQGLINYLRPYKVKKLAIVIGAREMIDLINEKYYKNQDGRILAAFGALFTKNIKVLVYPVMDEDGTTLIDAYNLPVPEGIGFLYKYLLESGMVIGIKDYNKDLLHIIPYMLLNEIRNDTEGWESQLPDILVKLIKEKGLFSIKQKVELATN